MSDYLELNLGSGDDIYPEPFKNYDFISGNGVEFIDLNKLPLPFKDKSCKTIILHDILEHLDINHYYFMIDIHRILVKGGIVDVWLPSYDSRIGHVKHRFVKDYFQELCREKWYNDRGVKPLFNVVKYKKMFDWFGLSMPFIHFKHKWVMEKR